MKFQQQTEDETKNWNHIITDIAVSSLDPPLYNYSQSTNPFVQLSSSLNLLTLLFNILYPEEDKKWETSRMLHKVRPSKEPALTPGVIFYFSVKN